MMLKIKNSLLLCLLFSIIINLNSILFAQVQKETRDPFLSIDERMKLEERPLDVSKLPYPIVLNGIIWTENLQIAIINNETVEKNQVWRDFKVEEIEKGKVTLRLGNNRFEISLAPEEEDGQKKN